MPASITATLRIMPVSNEIDMHADLRLALYQPDIAANTGAMMRLCACFGAGLDIIEPCGFVLDDQKAPARGQWIISNIFPMSVIAHGMNFRATRANGVWFC